MATIIKTKKQLFTRIPLGIAIICFIGLGPILIGAVGAKFTEMMTHEPCHEGNCFWGALGWLCMLTIPLALVLFVVFLILVVIDIGKLGRE